MAVTYSDLQDAYMYVNWGDASEDEAYLNKETGEFHFHTEDGDNFEELPDDIESEKYIALPSKIELDLGRRLVEEFVYAHLPDDADHVLFQLFRGEGAYSRFKYFLDEREMLDAWYEFSNKAEEKALRKWAEFHSIELSD